MPFVQANSVSGDASGTSLACAYHTPVAPGDLLVAAYGGHSATLGSAISDSQGNAWRLLTPATNASIPHTSGIAYAVASAAGIPTVTFTSVAATFRKLAVHEYSGVNTLDQQSGATGNSAAFSSGAKTTTRPVEVIFGWIIGNSGVSAPGTGFTSRSTFSQLTEDMMTTAVGSYAATGSGPSAQWIALMATFYAAASGPVLSVYGDDGSSASATISVGSPPVNVTPPVIS